MAIARIIQIKFLLSMGWLDKVCLMLVYGIKIFHFSSSGRLVSLCLMATTMYAACVEHARAQNRPIVGVEYQFGPLRREEFVEPPEKVESTFLRYGPNEKPKDAADEEVKSHGLSLSLGANYPLHSSSGGVDSQGSAAVSPTLQLGIRYNPVSYWFGQINFYRYLFADRQQAWDPDFSYSFGYEDWHNDTFSLIYSNYTGNRFSSSSENGAKRTNFNQGQWSLGYKFALPKILEPLFLVGDGDQIGCNVNVNITPRYSDLSTLSTKSYKKAVAFGCRYGRPSGWYADVTVFAYPTRSQQQPWDPDFSYGFGYFDPRPGSFSIQYSNYSGNRFPGHDLRGDGSLRKGGISISWNTQW